jgi:hypothetical protein
VALDISGRANASDRAANDTARCAIDFPRRAIDRNVLSLVMSRPATSRDDLITHAGTGSVTNS